MPLKLFYIVDGKDIVDIWMRRKLQKSVMMIPMALCFIQMLSMRTSWCWSELILIHFTMT